MSTIPKRVEPHPASITTERAIDPAWLAVKMTGPGLSVSITPGFRPLAFFHVRNAHEARETMQHITGVLEDLREFAEKLENPLKTGEAAGWKP